MKLLKYELLKIWGRPVILIYLAALLFVNLFFFNIELGTNSHKIPSDAYQSIYSDLQGLSPIQQSVIVDEKLKIANALQAVDYMFKVGRTRFSEQDKALLAEYGEMYRNSAYQLYCDDLTVECLFLSQISGELFSVSHYDEYLDNTQNTSNEINSFSVFSKGENAYALHSNALIAKAYSNLNPSNLNIRFYPEKGLVKALGFFISDIILCFSMFILAAVLIRQEKDSGLLPLLRTTPSGRVKAAVAKLCALAISLIPVILGVCGSNLLFSELRYGLGDLSRSVQSVSALQGCVFQISIWEYILMFLSSKWVACIIIGTLIMLCFLLSSNILTSCVVSTVFLLGEWYIGIVIPATGKLNVLKYANLVSMLKTNELLGAFRTVYWFKEPISLALVIIVSSLAFIAAFVVLFCIAMEYGKLTVRPKVLRTTKLFSAPTTIFKVEARKLLLHCGAAFVILTYLACILFVTVTNKSYVTEQEQVYASYMQDLQGPYTQKTVDKLNEFNHEFDELYRFDALYQNKKITQDEYYLQMSVQSGLVFKQNVFKGIINNTSSYIKGHPNAWLVNEKPYVQLLVDNTQRDIYDALFSTIATVLCFAGFLAMEYKAGMSLVIQSTPLGRVVTVRTKYRLMLIIQVVIAFFSVIPHLYRALQDYGLHTLFAPAMSIDSFLGLPAFIPLFAVVMFMPVFRAVACVAIGTIVLCLSQRIKNTLFAAFISFVILGLPMLLSLSGIQWLEWISFYPLFHATAFLQNGGGVFTLMFYLTISGISIWAGRFYLFDCWDVQYSEKLHV